MSVTNIETGGGGGVTEEGGGMVCEDVTVMLQHLFHIESMKLYSNLYKILYYTLYLYSYGTHEFRV